MKYNEMTMDEINACFDEFVMGKRKRILSDYVVINGKRRDIKTWIWFDEDPNSPAAGRTSGEKPPDYFSKLDLCIKGTAYFPFPFRLMREDTRASVTGAKYAGKWHVIIGCDSHFTQKWDNPSEAVTEACLRVVRPDLFGHQVGEK